MHITARIAMLGTALLLSACATDKLEHPSYWWDATVVGIGPAASIPPEVNRECIASLAGSAHGDSPMAIVVRYRVGKSSTTKAYLDTRGEEWRVGEKAYVHPDTCRIKHDFRPAS